MKSTNVLSACLVMSMIACSQQRQASENSGASSATGAAKSGELSGTIRIDGSSTVYPITEAVAEEFQKQHNKVRVTVGVSGTGGGMKKFCTGQLEITGASRPIKGKEIKKCAEQGIEFIEVPVAYDGIAVVLHKENNWAQNLTVADLKKIWEPEAQDKIKTWNQVRAEWPNKPLNLFGPGIDSGTYDYFTKAIVGTEHASRGDFTSSEDDNVIVQGVSTDVNGLGFFGFAYYKENAAKLGVAAISSDGAPGVKPSLTTVADGSYKPLSRPIFVYITKKAAARPDVQAFMKFYLAEQGRKLVEEVGYIGLPNSVNEAALKRFDAQRTGSIFEGGSKVGARLEEMLAK